MLPHIPILRFGERYESLDTNRVIDHATEEPLAIVSQANGGLIRRDLMRKSDCFRSIKKIPYRQSIAICEKAADIFLNDSIMIDEDYGPQSPDEYVDVLSRTTGLPISLCRQNMNKIHSVLSNLDKIINGLTRGVDPTIFDNDVISHADISLCYHPTCDRLGIVLPSNSPAVNSLWLPSIAMKIPVVVKPGSNDPWTSWRVIQSLIKAGCPADSFCYYPTGHDGSQVILEQCGRSIIFGDQHTVEKHAGNPKINVHGPGHSKIVIGEDLIGNWEDYKDVMLESILANSGRSCINASTIIVPKYRSEIAESLAKELATIKVLGLNDPDAQLAAFPTTSVAHAIDHAIKQSLNVVPGAVDRTMQMRSSPRLTELNGSAFLVPTLIECEDPAHPLANKEYLFPYVAVVEVPQEATTEYIGPTLSLTVFTKNQQFVSKLLNSKQVARLNIGPVPTTRVDWSQPHEGNLFELLYRRIAIQQN